MSTQSFKSKDCISNQSDGFYEACKARQAMFKQDFIKHSSQNFGKKSKDGETKNVEIVADKAHLASKSIDDNENKSSYDEDAGGSAIPINKTVFTTDFTKKLMSIRSSWDTGSEFETETQSLADSKQQTSKPHIDSEGDGSNAYSKCATDIRWDEIANDMYPPLISPHGSPASSSPRGSNDTAPMTSSIGDLDLPAAIALAGSLDNTTDGMFGSQDLDVGVMNPRDVMVARMRSLGRRKASTYLKQLSPVPEESEVDEDDDEGDDSDSDEDDDDSDDDDEEGEDEEASEDGSDWNSDDDNEKEKGWNALDDAQKNQANFRPKSSKSKRPSKQSKKIQMK